jgi:multiple sugar transport system substrate-binding protein
MKSMIRQHWGVMFLTAVALSFIALQAFFSTQRKNSVVEIYFADRMTEAHHHLIAEFNRLHEGAIKVIPIDFPNADFTTNERKEVLARSLRGEGDNIDVFAVDVVWVQRFARWGEPLDQYFDKPELDGITKEILQSCYKDGKLVAIPFDQVRGVLLYRQDLLSALPGGKRIMAEVNRGITWDDFIQYGIHLQSTRPFYIFPAAEYEGLLCVYSEVLLSRGKDYFAKHGFDFQTPQAEKSLQLLVDLVQKYNVTPKEVTSMTEVSSYEYFTQNQGLFLRGWTSYDRDFTMMADRKKLLRMAPPPHFKDGLPALTIGGWDLMVSKFSPKKKEAISFIKFLLRRESQEIIYTEGGYFPVIRALFEDSTYKIKYPELIETYQMLAGGVHRPSHEKYTKYSEILAHYVSSAIRGDMPVADALRKATQAIESEKITLALGVDR